MIIGYARVSTTDQNTDGQEDQLTAAGAERVYVDRGVSGKNANRPQWDELRRHMRAGDVVVAVKLDRIGRSTSNLLDVANELRAAGVDLRILGTPIDTTTPTGTLLFTMLSAVAQFERDLIRERTLDGLAAARARGRTGGRPPALTPGQREIARQAYTTGLQTADELAEAFGIGRSTMYRVLQDADV